MPDKLRSASAPHRWLAAVAVAPLFAFAAGAHGASAPAPRNSSYTALNALPDFSGVWIPDVRDQFRKEVTDRPPWNAKTDPEMAKMEAEEKAGRPALILANCFAHGMPAFMLITHNAIEFLFTPGRITILGESDGNRLRRIYTDGRKHPEDPTPTFHGHSIGHWEGETLVVDTVGVAPQAYIATSEGVGVPNDGEIHIVERISLTGPDALVDELTITAPKALSKPWTTKRLFKRMRGESADIVEGQCVEGQFTAGKDKNGHDIFVPIPQQADGAIRAQQPSAK